MKDCGKERPGLEQLRGILQDSWRSPVRSGQEPWSGYERSRQARWDAREMRTATTKVRREVYEEFRRLCRARRETPYSVLQGFLLAFVDYFGGEAQDKPRFTGWHTSGGG